jgi:hypothetical protein
MIKARVLDDKIFLSYLEGSDSIENGHASPSPSGSIGPNLPAHNERLKAHWTFLRLSTVSRTHFGNLIYTSLALSSTSSAKARSRCSLSQALSEQTNPLTLTPSQTALGFPFSQSSFTA